MYIVVSRWEAVPGHEDQFRTGGEEMHSFMRRQPGVEFFQSFKTENGQVVVIHAYTDEDAYNRLINDPNGVFNQKLQEVDIEQHSRWLGSERGEALFPGVTASKEGSATMR